MRGQATIRFSDDPVLGNSLCPPVSIARETFVTTVEELFVANTPETFVAALETFVAALETFVATVETFVMIVEPFVVNIETFVATRETFVTTVEETLMTTAPAPVVVSARAEFVLFTTVQPRYRPTLAALAVTY